MFEHTLTQRCD